MKDARLKTTAPYFVGNMLDLPEREPEIKPGTCAACKWFKNPKYYSRHMRMEGCCHNKIATIGTVLFTGWDSTCKYHEPKHD